MEVLREIGSALAKLRASLQDVKKDFSTIERLHESLSRSLVAIWEPSNISELLDSSPIWRECLDLVASGRVVGVMAQAETELNKSRDAEVTSDFADHGRFIKYLMCHLGHFYHAGQARNDASVRPAASQLCSKAMAIGRVSKADVQLGVALS